MPSPGTAPGVTAGTGTKQAVTGGAAQVNKKFSLAPRGPDGSLLALRDNQDSTVPSFSKGVGQGQAWASGAENGKERP